MFSILGLIIVGGAIIGGYMMEHGNMHVLIQPAELVVIGGSSIGALVVSSPPKKLIQIIKSLPAMLKGSKGKKAYLELLGLLYSLFSKIKKEGLLAVEKDIEEPDKSQVFTKYPTIAKNHHLVSFICDNLRVFVVGVRPMDLEEMMDIEMDTHHDESNYVPSVLSKIGDSLPGFGIVAAVLGVVITMGKMSEGPEVIGESVAAALVGTFLGILLSYGVVGPIASNQEQMVKEDAKFLEVIKASITAFSKDLPPQMAVEAGRRVIYSDAKPSFQELEQRLKQKK